MASEARQIPDTLKSLVADWARSWGLPGLEDRLEIEFSARFRSSLGRCRPGSDEIRLAEFLLTGRPEVLREALCHEAAHAAVYHLHGPNCRPHGAEWRGLMEAAGFEPRVRVPARLLPDAPERRVARGRLWEHRCPVCHASRVARRRVSRWRCALCRSEGLAGDLVISELRGQGWRS